MRRLLQSVLVSGAVLTSAALTFAADVPPTVEFPPVSNNAALQYWQAFSMLPALDEKQEKLLENWAHAPLDEAAVKLLDQAEASLMFLHRGAKLSQCDWGFDFRDGVSMYLPHLVKGRTLARLAALDARRAFENRQYDRARDDAYGMMALARQIGRDHALVSLMVCYAIEGMTVDLVTPYLPKIGGSYQDAVLQSESLPPSPQLVQAVLSEKRLASTIIGQLQEAEKRQPGSWRETWHAVLGPGSPDPFKELESLDQLIDVLEGFQPFYDELAQLAALPHAEFDARYPEFVKRAGASNPVVKMFLPAMDKTIARQRRAEVRAAMLLAAVAVVESGPEKLAAIKDPFGDGQFKYRRLGEGFELSSKLQEDGKPVSLVIGQKKLAPAP